MKKLLTSIFALCGFFYPILAQVDHDYNPNDRIPLINTIITKEQIPAAVLKAANTQFNENDQLTWSKFPFALKEYGWVYDVGAEDIKLNRFEVTMKTKQGGDFWAVYAPNGNLIETRETSINIAMPPSVMKALSQSNYKDWKVVGDKEIIKYYRDGDNASVEQHFRITVEKNNVRRSISFNNQQSAKK